MRQERVHPIWFRNVQFKFIYSLNVPAGNHDLRAYEVPTRPISVIALASNFSTLRRSFLFLLF